MCLSVCSSPTAATTFDGTEYVCRVDGASIPERRRRLIAEEGAGAGCDADESAQVEVIGVWPTATRQHRSFRAFLGPPDLQEPVRPDPAGARANRLRSGFRQLATELAGLFSDNQDGWRIASSRNAPERVEHCLTRMLPAQHQFVNRTRGFRHANRLNGGGSFRRG